MKKLVIQTLLLILCLSAVFAMCGVVSIIEQGTGAIETIICTLLTIASFQILKRIGDFEIYE